MMKLLFLRHVDYLDKIGCKMKYRGSEDPFKGSNVRNIAINFPWVKTEMSNTIGLGLCTYVFLDIKLSIVFKSNK